MKQSSKWLAVSVLVFGMGLMLTRARGEDPSATEAPAGFDNLTNGMVDQTTHDLDRTTFFEEVDTVKSGLGPVYNGTSCAGCHSGPVDGGSGATAELRAGHTDSSGNFVNPTVVIDNGKSVIADRSLINTFSICPLAQETVPDTETIRTLRMTSNTLGDGFVEAVDDSTLLAIAQNQRTATGGVIHGDAIQVPVMEAPGTTRVGRFGWKDQQPSVLSFAADAYLNEQGITNYLLPNEITNVCDHVADPEDTVQADGLADIDHFARFIRATKVPPVDSSASTDQDVQIGSHLFNAIGCATCHVSTMQTAPPGTVINGGSFTVPEALGNKTIHPFSDFLLHDIGTGDGIVQNGGQASAPKVRTAPLWGLRTRNKMLHDGSAGSYYDAVTRHAGEAIQVINTFYHLNSTQQQQIMKFLGSL